jgi:hypothetical protein
MERSILLGLLNFQQIWLAVPLALAFSVVYAATRSETPRFIAVRAAKIAGWLFFFLILVGVVLHFVA